MKKLLGSDIAGSYVFDPSSRTITFSSTTLLANQLLLITNMADNIIIYNFADPSTGGTFLNNVLTLTYNTTSMSASDPLQIFVDVPDTSMEESSATLAVLKQMLHLLKPLGIVTGSGSNRLQTDVYSISTGTIGTVTTVGTVTNVRDIGTIPNGGFNQMKDISTVAFQSLRSNIV